MEMWLRFAAHAAVGVLSCDQGYYRVHGKNMHKATFTSAMTVLRQHEEAFATLFREYGDRIPDRERMHRMAMRGTALNALGRAAKFFEGGDRESCDRFLDAALLLFPDLRGEREWSAPPPEADPGTSPLAGAGSPAEPPPSSSPRPKPLPLRPGWCLPGGLISIDRCLIAHPLPCAARCMVSPFWALPARKLSKTMFRRKCGPDDRSPQAPGWKAQALMLSGSSLGGRTVLGLAPALRVHGVLSRIPAQLEDDTMNYSRFWRNAKATTRRSRHSVRPRLEMLEDRALLAPLTIAQENQLPGTARDSGTSARQWRPDDPGFRHGHERQRGADHLIQNR